MLESRFEKLTSPASMASDAMAMNWMLVKPCSTVSEVASAASTQSAFIITSSKKLRTAMMPHSLVWKPFWHQSKRGSSFSRSWLKRMSSWAWRISSSIPKAPMLRQRGLGAKRLKRLCMVTAICSTMQVAPMCRCDEAWCPSSSLL